MVRQLHRLKNVNMPQNATTPEEIRLRFSNDDIKERFGMSKHEIPLNFYVDTIVETNYAFTLFISQSM